MMRNRQRRLVFRAAPLLAATLLLAACGDPPAPSEGMEKPLMSDPMPRVISLSEAVQTPDLPAIDPQTLDEAEIDKVLGTGPRCAFAYTAESPPVLVVAMAEGAAGAQGLLKIHGRLTTLSNADVGSLEALAAGVVLTADGARVEVAPQSPAEPGQRQAANLHFELKQGLLVGYHGWYVCRER